MAQLRRDLVRCQGETETKLHHDSVYGRARQPGSIGFAGMAWVAGTWVLLTPEGTLRHAWMGYMYVGSMMMVLSTAFGIYHLFGRFGIVHLRLLTLCGSFTHFFPPFLLR